MSYNSYNNMQPEHLAYWLERAKADLTDRDVLIQNQRNEIERLTRSLQEVNYNTCMQTSIIAYEVQKFAREHSRVLVPSGAAQGDSGSVPVLKLSDLESFLSQLTGGILSGPTTDASCSSTTTAGCSSSSAQGTSSVNTTDSVGSNTAGGTSTSGAGDVASAAVAASVASLNRLQQMRMRFSSKRCRDECVDDGRPLRPGQWFVLPAQQDVQ